LIFLNKFPHLFQALRIARSLDAEARNCSQSQGALHDVHQVIGDIYRLLPVLQRLA
jgi:hypothetical protein